MKDLLFAGHELGVQVNFTPIPLEQYEHWVGEQGKERRMITMMGHECRPSVGGGGSCAEHNLNIDAITRLWPPFDYQPGDPSQSCRTTDCVGTSGR